MMETVGEVDAFTTDSEGDESDVPIISLVTPNKKRKKQRRISTEPTQGAKGIRQPPENNNG
jgi:hypothetical protein